MIFINELRRKRLDRIKNRVMWSTARYYIKKNADKIKTLRSNHKIELAAEKKDLEEYYDGRLKLLNDKIDRLNKDVEWYREQWKDYCDLKDKLERISGSIDADSLQRDANLFIAKLFSAQNKIEYIDNKHRQRDLVGVK